MCSAWLGQRLLRWDQVQNTFYHIIFFFSAHSFFHFVIWSAFYSFNRNECAALTQLLNYYSLTKIIHTDAHTCPPNIISPHFHFHCNVEEKKKEKEILEMNFCCVIPFSVRQSKNYPEAQESKKIKLEIHLIIWNGKKMYLKTSESLFSVRFFFFFCPSRLRMSDWCPFFISILNAEYSFTHIAAT